MRRFALPLLTLAACAWLAAVLAAPAAAAGAPLSAAAYALGSFVCHQQSARSFYLAGAQLPVCARCTGLYAGVTCGALLCALWRPMLRFSRLRMLLVASAAPTVITWVGEAVRLAEPSNLTRAIAAAPLGLAVATAVMATASGRLR